MRYFSIEFALFNTSAIIKPISANLDSAMNTTASGLESDDDGIQDNSESSHLMIEDVVDPKRQDAAKSKRLAAWRTRAVWLLLGAIFGIVTTLLATLTRDTDGTCEYATCGSHIAAATTDCGGSPAEARARGCKFDIMSFSWLPSECYDDQLHLNSAICGLGKWYSDPNSTESVVPEDIVKLGEHEYLYVSAEYHFFHCTFMWRKMHRVALGLGSMDSYIYNYNHTTHCETMLHDKSSMVIDSTIFTKYPECWPALAPHQGSHFDEP